MYSCFKKQKMTFDIEQYIENLPIPNFLPKKTEVIETTSELIPKKPLGLKKSQSIKSLNVYDAYQQNTNYNSFQLYYQIKLIIPEESEKYIDELIMNRKNNLSNCCNPSCKRHIMSKHFFAFDGYFCTHQCRMESYVHIYDSWNKIITNNNKKLI